MPAPSDFETSFRELTPFLLDQGWLYPPKILGGELDALWDRCERFRQSPPQDAATRREAESEISLILVFNAFHPNYRAYYVWLAMQQPHMESFSHLIEAGVFHYLQRDYLSCVHCVLPAVEGVLRSHFRAHNPNHQGNLSYRQLSTFLRSDGRPVRSYRTWHEMYRNALADFLERWLWVRTDNADWDLSHLNRHYALHGLGTEHYYRSEDCHRLFTFLDLYMEMLVLETRIGEYAMIPDHVDIERRRDYYTELMGWNIQEQPTSARSAFLREHPHYHQEEPRESIAEQVYRWGLIMGLDRFPTNANRPDPATRSGARTLLRGILARLRR